jgi:methylthioxylose transferase
MTTSPSSVRVDAGRVDVWLPAAVFAVVAGTIAYGFAARAAGHDLGAAGAPFLWDWQPKVGAAALPATASLAIGVALAPRLLRADLRPWAFAALTLGLGLGLRVALGGARGLEGLWSVYEIGRPEAVNEYLPALPAFDFGTRVFLDTWAEVGTSLPPHAIGHPPGLLLLMHSIGIQSASGMAALTIGAGALSVPLCYLLARSLLAERDARTATLLYVFAPSAILYGATSADALYATLALAAAIPLAAAARANAPLAAGAALLAVASFFSYSNLAIGAWATLVAERRAGLRRALLIAGACGVALALGYGLLYLATGYDPIGALRSAESVYREGIASRRPYAFWVFGSPAAFLGALGLPIAWYASRSVAARWAPALALAAIVVIAAVLGFTKAETERIYQFLVPLACIAAAASLPRRVLPAALVMLAVQTLAIELLVDTVW